MPFDNAPATTAGNTPEAGKKYFTLEEANRALPYVARIIDDVMVSYQRVVELRRQLKQLTEADDAEKIEASYDAAMDTLSRLVEELEQAGVELKDFEVGLLDFPALHEGREVLLCWRKGEAKVDHWHEVDAGFSGRQPVEAIKKPKSKSKG